MLHFSDLATDAPADAAMPRRATFAMTRLHIWRRLSAGPTRHFKYRSDATRPPAAEMPARRAFSTGGQDAPAAETALRGFKEAPATSAMR